MDKVSFSEEHMDDVVEEGGRQNSVIETDNQSLKSDFSQILDESGGDIAAEFNAYTNELNEKLNTHLEALERADEALKSSREGFTTAKEISANQIRSRD